MKIRYLIGMASVALMAGMTVSVLAETPKSGATNILKVPSKPQASGPKRMQRMMSQQEIKRNYKKGKWMTYQRQLKLKAPQGTAKIPETDCPPLPTKDCLDTWDNAFQAQPAPSQAQVKRNWKKSKWHMHQGRLKLKGGRSAIPPTDCPPLPTQDCLDTWEVK